MEAIHFHDQTLVDVAYQALKRDITTRVLSPRQKLITRELHERYGISETPIKQALNRLLSEGLVESTPRKGVRVKDMTLADVVELLDMRKMMETYYTRQILAHFAGDKELQKRFSLNLAEHRQIVTHGTGVSDHFRNYTLDLLFHQMFMQCAGNQRALHVYNALGTHVYAYYIYGLQSQAENLAGVVEHETIFAAMLAQDEHSLRAAVETHLDNAKTKISGVFKHRPEK